MDQENKHIINTELLIRYFANEATEAERAEVETWRDKNDPNLKEFNALLKLWNITGNVVGYENIDINAEWNKAMKSITPQKSKIILLKRGLQIAASILLIASLSIYIYRKIEITTQKSNTAEISKFQLPDGSLIHLNASSKISYDKNFGKTHRKISLIGEAFFKVVRNEKIPFIIEAKNTKIEVLGTEFNIKAYKSEVEVKVTVTKGKVKFYEIKKPDQKIILTGGESGIYNKKDKNIEKQPKQNLNDIAWVTRKIDFENTILADVGKVLQNTYHKEFKISENIKDCPITVSFNNLSLEHVLKVLQSTLNLEIVKDKNKIIVSGKGC